MTESGVILSPVSIAESPSATERNNGTTKNNPIITTNWKKNIRSPPFRPRSISDGVNSGSLPSSSSRRIWDPNSRRVTSPATISQNTGDMPRIEGPSPEARNQPHSPDFRTPVTMSPIARAHSTDPSRSR